jgi:RHS repeat-associated protein
VAGTTETYTYDGDGVRFSRQVGAGSLTRYVTDPSGSLPVTIADGARSYVWGLGLAYAVAGSSVEVYDADRLGSIRAISDASGALTATYRTDEWGVPTATSGSSSQPFGFTGEPVDATGLVYLRARYYHPDLGRFMTRDAWPGQVSASGSLNRFAYAEANPATLADPSGQCAQALVLAFAGPAGVVAGGGITFGCAVVAIAAAGVGAWLFGSAVGQATASALQDGLQEIRDQRIDKPIPAPDVPWKMVQEPYLPYIHQYPPGEDPIGPKGPRFRVSKKLLFLLGLGGTLVVVKSGVLRDSDDR